MAHEKNSNPHAEKYFKIIRSKSSRVQNSINNQPVQKENYERADKSPFFGKSSKNEVRLRLRQKFEPRLRAKTKALAQDLPASDRDSGLESIVTRTMDIRQRIDKVGNSVFLILGKN